MDVGRPGPVVRAHRNMQPLTKQTTPVKVKKTVSVAVIFKKQPQKIKKQLATSHMPTENSRKTAHNSPDKKAQSLKSRSSSRTPQKAGWKVSRKRPGVHPLATEFKDASDNYRRHLYNTATSRINKTLTTLINNLYENTLQPLSSDANSAQDSPVRLTIPAKFEREALKLYQPISAYQVRLTRTDTDGERVHFTSTLEDRMVDYKEHIATQRAEVEKLKRDWETIVGEIWKVGEICLGAEAMESLLFTKKATHTIPSPHTKSESTLFVHEGTSPPAHSVRSKKRVTFEAPADEHDMPDTNISSLEFLHQPSRLRAKPVAAAPGMPEAEIQKLETQVRELGKKETEELRKAEKAHKVYWQEMNNKLMNVFAG